MTSTALAPSRRRSRPMLMLRRYGMPAVIGGLVVLLVQFMAWPAFQDRVLTLPMLGAFGDFIGGYVGTFVALISVILLYYNLREQRRAIREQRRSLDAQQRANDSQRVAAERASFENKYFALIQMHRDNVAEMRLYQAQGRRVFVDMMRELRAILQVVRHVEERENSPLTQRERCSIGFYCLFYGVGPNAGRQLRKAFTGYPPAFFERLNRLLSRPMVWTLAQRRQRFTHRPFDGHQSRLGHYYRHLYQTFRFIDEQDFLDELKYEYAKTVRAQLSTHEQALLFVNSISPQGQGWWDRDFMKKYRLVQNIPENFFDKDLEVDLKADEFFGKTRYFEWEPR